MLIDLRTAGREVIIVKLLLQGKWCAMLLDINGWKRLVTEM